MDFVHISSITESNGSVSDDMVTGRLNKLLQALVGHARS